jgi:hypothetical protein
MSNNSHGHADWLVSQGHLTMQTTLWNYRSVNSFPWTQPAVFNNLIKKPPLLPHVPHLYISYTWTSLKLLFDSRENCSVCLNIDTGSTYDIVKAQKLNCTVSLLLGNTKAHPHHLTDINSCNTPSEHRQLLAVLPLALLQVDAAFWGP